MIRFLIIWKLRFRAWVLMEQIIHAEELMDEHKRQYEVCCIEYRKVCSRLATLQSPEVIVRNALRERT